MIWNPIKELEKVFSQMEDFYDDFEEDYLPQIMLKEGAPPFDLAEEDGKLILFVDLPGVDEEDVDIEVKGKNVLIYARRDKDIEETKLIKEQRFKGTFRKKIKLPYNVDTEDSLARLKNGVLKVILKRSQDEEKTNIEIE
ncbi:MAG: Molecular chaperone HSP20 family, IbpA [Candidatus Methanohalarchaeum thermophilum]|uniref:Molecular chaperone HSP20 family, IbpA n=1 Tax=Methanohalarchaeum thermophilum TaxID=1903181 RepID=A0A1Q6DUM5_METT1|nr:MAG: Molecular chaperone HSP20 family, IbpA [Candidatus Methanohalarchaeum thermophilum]